MKAHGRGTYTPLVGANLCTTVLGTKSVVTAFIKRSRIGSCMIS